jgi:hypothetical protein
MTTDQHTLKSECVQLWRSGSKPRTIVARGLSMHPLIREGTTLTVMPPAGVREIALGDIVLFERDNAVIAHRIVGRFHQNNFLWFREKGDNTFLPGCFPASALIGRIVKIENNGYVRDLTRPWQRLLSRAAGSYWWMLFAALRFLSICKRAVFGSVEFPRLRSLALRLFRVLGRLPVRIFKP